MKTTIDSVIQIGDVVDVRVSFDKEDGSGITKWQTLLPATSYSIEYMKDVIAEKAVEIEKISTIADLETDKETANTDLPLSIVNKKVEKGIELTQEETALKNK